MASPDGQLTRRRPILPIASPEVTEPMARPRPGWARLGRPRIGSGAIATVEAAEGLAKRGPSGLEWLAMNALSAAG